MLSGTASNDKPFIKSSSEQWGSIDLNNINATFVNAVSRSTEKLNYSDTVKEADSTRLVYEKEEFGIYTAIFFVKYKDPKKAFWLQHAMTRNEKTIKSYYNCMKS